VTNKILVSIVEDRNIKVYLHLEEFILQTMPTPTQLLNVRQIQEIEILILILRQLKQSV
jgi:hypothetical protein